MNKRADYAVVGAAIRQAHERAATADPRLTAREWAVLSAVITLTASYSRLVDRIYVAQIAAQAFGVERDAIQGGERRDWRIEETGRALRRLRGLGIVVYEPARGRGRQSLIGLQPPLKKARATSRLSGDKKARATSRLSGDKRRAIPPVKGARHLASSREVSREETSGASRWNPNPDCPDCGDSETRMCPRCSGYRNDARAER